jgi:hypothetical protein
MIDKELSDGMNEGSTETRAEFPGNLSLQLRCVLGRSFPSSGPMARSELSVDHLLMSSLRSKIDYPQGGDTAN